MVSISTLFAFWMVALALIWNRHYVRGVTPAVTTTMVVMTMLAMIGSSIGKTSPTRWFRSWISYVVMALPEVQEVDFIEEVLVTATNG